MGIDIFGFKPFEDPFFADPVKATVGGVTSTTDNLWKGAGDVARGSGNLVSDLTGDLLGGLFGSKGKKDFQEGGLLGGGVKQAGGLQGNLLGAGFGGFASAAGLNPKTLMFVAAGAVVLIVVLLVVLKT